MTPGEAMEGLPMTRGPCRLMASLTLSTSVMDIGTRGRSGLQKCIHHPVPLYCMSDSFPLAVRDLGQEAGVDRTFEYTLAPRAAVAAIGTYIPVGARCLDDAFGEASSSSLSDGSSSDAGDV